MLFKSDHQASHPTEPASASPGIRSKPRGAASVVHADMTVTGNFAGEGELRVDGTVEGDIKCQTLTVGEGARVKGEVAADTVTISGILQGRIQARIVGLTRSAEVEGHVVVSEALSIDAGAHFDGEIQRSQAKAAETRRGHDETFAAVKDELSRPIAGHGGEAEEEHEDDAEDVEAARPRQKSASRKIANG